MALTFYQISFGLATPGQSQISDLFLAFACIAYRYIFSSQFCLCMPLKDPQECYICMYMAYECRAIKLQKSPIDFWWIDHDLHSKRVPI